MKQAQWREYYDRPITGVPRASLEHLRRVLMKQRIAIVILLIFALAFSVPAQENIDQSVIARIKTECFQNSKIMDTVSHLTDVYGPRLRGSANYKAAAEWCRERLIHWGLDKSYLERGGFVGRGWSLSRFSVEMIEPQYMNITAQPMSWSPSTNGAVSGPPILVEVSSPADFDKYRGKLGGLIVVNGAGTRAVSNRFLPDATRFSDEELEKGAQATDPAASVLVPYSAQSYATTAQQRRQYFARRAAIARFFRDEGVAALLVPSRLDSNLIFATDAGGFDMTAADYGLPVPELTIPSLVIGREHYGRIARLLEKKIPVKLEVNLKTVSREASEDSSVIAEIPGTDPRLKDEVVMLGAHLDSWQAGTGATDNASGCAVMMEVMRILHAIGAKPRRTVRLALWNGEEGGPAGSLAYVRKHFGDPATMELKPEHETLSAYFNLDGGTGRIRGILLQGNEMVRPIFESYLRPFYSLGATTLAIQSVGSTDHIAFDYLGLPAFVFLQDWIDYETRTHHTNMDLYEAVLEQDLKQAAVVVAGVVYQTAMRDEKLPRKPLPPVPPKP